jgi:origin recognition complex subunit 5
LETLRALGLEDEWERFGKGKCEHVSTLVVLLSDILSSTDKVEGNSGNKEKRKFILVLDGIDKQREASQMLLAALARLGEAVRFLPLLFPLLPWYRLTASFRFRL